MTQQGVNYLAERKKQALQYALQYNNIYTVLYCKTIKKPRGIKARQSLKDYIFWDNELHKAMKILSIEQVNI